MQEITAIKAAVKPSETLFVVDSMTGQDAVNTAKEFNDRLDFDGVVLTKLDGDTRGGAAISIRSVVDKPLKFISSGEKMDALQVFHPERMADRILGMGDVVSLVERAQEQFDDLQMNYWAALPLGFSAAHEAMLRFFLDHAMESGRDAAKRMFGCRGIWWTWAFDPECRPAYSGTPWGIWCGVVLWMAQHYYAQYEYTQDLEYLRTAGYPFLKECAQFLEDFIFFREDGTAVFSPSQSPENQYKGAEKYCISLCENSTIDVELCNELLTNVIAAAEKLGVDEADRKVWADLKAKLPPLKIGEDGRLLEWEQPFEEVAPDHRHVSHLYAGGELHSLDTPSLLLPRQDNRRAHR